MAMSVFFVAGLLVYFVIFGALWALVNFGLYRMAKHAGIPNPWLAFLPVANAYVVGLLAERSLYTYTGRQRRLALWNAVFQAVPLVGLMFVVGLALLDSDFNALVGLSVMLLVLGGIAGTVLYWYSLYYVFKDYAPDNAVLYTVLGLVLGIYWVFLLVEMNTVPVSVTGFGVFPYGRPKYDRYHQWQVPPVGQYPPPPPPQQGPYTTGGWGPNGYEPGQQFYQGQAQGYYRPERPGQEDDGPQGPEVK